MLNKILSIFSKKPSQKSELISEIEKIYSVIPQDFGGGCTIQKGLLMSLIIKEFKLKKTVDLGVYRGRSLFPQAIAHKLYSDGVVYGVDPYSNIAAIQNDRPDLKKQLDNFAENTDFELLYNDVKLLVEKNGLKRNCLLVREKSSDAASYFKNNNHELDLVHIDGNHDTKFVMEDATSYLPLLKQKGFIVLDDISWDSVRPAYDMLINKMVFIDSLVDKQNDFALFAQGCTDDECDMLKKLFLTIKN